MNGISECIERKLKLKVNREKSEVGKVFRRKYLGYSFYFNYRTKSVRFRVHPKSIKKLKGKIRKITNRNGL